jgi:hypothetical protein
MEQDEKNAMRLIECFEGRKMDYSMLLYLQLPQSQIDSHPILKPIQDICMDFGVTVMRHHFFKTVGNYIYSSGIREITPMSFVNARGKDDLLKEYKKRNHRGDCTFRFVFKCVVLTLLALFFSSRGLGKMGCTGSFRFSRTQMCHIKQTHTMLAAQLSMSLKNPASALLSLTVRFSPHNMREGSAYSRSRTVS